MIKVSSLYWHIPRAFRVSAAVSAGVSLLYFFTSSFTVIAVSFIIFSFLVEASLFLNIWLVVFNVNCRKYQLDIIRFQSWYLILSLHQSKLLK